MTLCKVAVTFGKCS